MITDLTYYQQHICVTVGRVEVRGGRSFEDDHS